MSSETRGLYRVLVAIPAFNEENTIAAVIERLRGSVPDFELLVVDDGSEDRTAQILRSLRVRTARHPCNIGYGRSVQTAMKYALRHDYDALITQDADGQHRPELLADLLTTFRDHRADLLIGSRFIATRRYGGGTFQRRLGMRLFSTVLRVVAGHRVYDTSSGLRVLSRRACTVLSSRPFVDFHAEAIAYLLGAGCRVEEYPVVVDERHHGSSMYSALAALKYPVKNLILIFLAALDMRLLPPARHDD